MLPCHDTSCYIFCYCAITLSCSSSHDAIPRYCHATICHATIYMIQGWIIATTNIITHALVFSSALLFQLNLPIAFLPVFFLLHFPFAPAIRPWQPIRWSIRFLPRWFALMHTSSDCAFLCAWAEALAIAMAAAAVAQQPQNVPECQAGAQQVAPFRFFTFTKSNETYPIRKPLLSSIHP